MLKALAESSFLLGGGGGRLGLPDGCDGCCCGSGCDCDSGFGGDSGCDGGGDNEACSAYLN